MPVNFNQQSIHKNNKNVKNKHTNTTFSTIHIFSFLVDDKFDSIFMLYTCSSYQCLHCNNHFLKPSHKLFCVFLGFLNLLIFWLLFPIFLLFLLFHSSTSGTHPVAVASLPQQLPVICPSTCAQLQPASTSTH